MFLSNLLVRTCFFSQNSLLLFKLLTQIRHSVSVAPWWQSAVTKVRQMKLVFLFVFFTGKVHSFSIYLTESIDTKTQLSWCLKNTFLKGFAMK